MWTRRQLKKLVKNGATTKTDVEGQQAPMMAEVSPQRRGRKGRQNDVPFGVRAIESGIGVEGVWISRSTSPMTTPGGSPRSSTMNLASPAGKGHSRDSSIPHLSMPEPAVPYSRASTRSADSSPDRSRATSPGLESPSKIRPTYKPRQSSHLRFSSGNVLDEMTAQDGKVQNHLPRSSSLTSDRRPIRAST